MPDKRSIVVALDLTRLCNNRCLYCFAYPEHTAPQPNVMISFEDACRLLHIVADEFALHSVRFTGGEATLHPKLVDLIAFAHHTFHPKLVVLLTNGRRLRRPSFCQPLYDAGLTAMQISLESDTAAIHDQMVGVRGAWAETVEGIKMALRLHPWGERGSQLINVKTTVSELNRHTLEATVRFIASLGVRSFSMNICTPAGRGAEQTALVPRVEERVQILANAQALAQALGLYAETHVSFDLCAENPDACGLRHYACGRGRDFISLDCMGNLHLCEVWGKQGGNLLTAGSVRALWQTDEFKYFWHGRRMPDRCRVCEHLRQCGGVCPVAAEAGQIDHIYRRAAGVVADANRLAST
jgi:radical SAM protein with 4Fe4S-binding SPASM domain